jgi:hypothetical protein
MVSLLLQSSSEKTLAVVVAVVAASSAAFFVWNAPRTLCWPWGATFRLAKRASGSRLPVLTLSRILVCRTLA